MYARVYWILYKAYHRLRTFADRSHTSSNGRSGNNVGALEDERRQIRHSKKLKKVSTL